MLQEKAQLNTLSSPLNTDASPSTERGFCTQHPAAFIVSKKQADTINSLTKINDGSTFYLLDYVADYKLDELLRSNIDSQNALTNWVASNLLATSQQSNDINMGGGCSAFVAQNREGNLIFGRNYDYMQNAQNIMVFCAPENGFKSVSMVAGAWIYDKDANGDYIVIGDGTTDLSMLVAAPYLLMDGINQQGLMIGVLALDGDGAHQRENGKQSLQTTTAMRLVLDRAANVPEAISLLKKYNMHSSVDVCNYHFMLADAQGRYAILEYAPDGTMRYSHNGQQDFRNILTDPDAEYDERIVTNFYRLFPASEYGFDDGSHGRDRFDMLSRIITNSKDRLDESQAILALRSVYQDLGATATHETQWSVVYNPVEFTARICVREDSRDDKETFYASEYSFDFKEAFQGKGSITWTKSRVH